MDAYWTCECGAVNRLDRESCEVCELAREGPRDGGALGDIFLERDGVGRTPVVVDVATPGAGGVGSPPGPIHADPASIPSADPDLGHAGGVDPSVREALAARRPVLDPRGLTVAEAGVLEAFRRCRRARPDLQPTAAEVASIVPCATSTALAIITRLVQKGHLERITHEPKTQPRRLWRLTAESVASLHLGTLIAIAVGLQRIPPSAVAKEHRDAYAGLWWRARTVVRDCVAHCRTQGTAAAKAAWREHLREGRAMATGRPTVPAEGDE